MRGRHLFGTLKNRLDPHAAVALTLQVRDLVRPDADAIVGICPSWGSMGWVSACKGALAVAAQNCGWNDSYSLTGEASPNDLKAFSVGYCIIGHSERRLHLGETEEMIARKLAGLIAASVIPILCVGETLSERDGDATTEVLRRQLTTLRDAYRAAGREPRPEDAIIAYEPMWAISTAGSNRTMAPADATASHLEVRALLDDIFGSGFGEATSVIFGGSVNASNAASFFESREIDGGLVGTGMQTSEGFKAVLEAFYAS